MIKQAKDWASEIVRRADEAGIITDHDGLGDRALAEDVLERAMQEAAESGVL